MLESLIQIPATIRLVLVVFVSIIAIKIIFRRRANSSNSLMTPEMPDSQDARAPLIANSRKSNKLEKDTVLNVPYVEKDQAKSLGAKWNPSIKKWYVPAGCSTKPFDRWLPIRESNPDIILLSPIFVIQSAEPCWKCRKWTPVITLSAQRSRSISGAKYDKFVVCSYINQMSEELEQALTKEFSFYSRDYSKTTDSRYMMNHCSCGAKLGDFYMFNEPRGAFYPLEKEDVKGMTLLELTGIKEEPILGEFSTNCGHLISQYAKRDELTLQGITTIKRP